MIDIEEKIKDVLEKIRPFLQNDGGDVEYVGFENGIVKVKMIGACLNCPLVDSTINDGVELILIDEVPGVIGVEVINKNEIKK
jgi:Fe-S cluster biogenesis protein NfuA